MAETILLDADSHVSEPLNLWKERLPAKYRDIAPHMETRYDGQPGAWWFIEQDRHPHNVILGFGANKSIEELQKLLEGFSYAGAHAAAGTRAAAQRHGSGRRRRRRALHDPRLSHVLDQRRRFSTRLFSSL
jgi:hypothetical protein